MEYAFEKFPDEYLNATTILAQVYTRTGELSKATEIWKVGIQKGYAYGLDNAIYQKYFQETLSLKYWLKKRASLVATMHMEHEVLLPKT